MKFGWRSALGILLSVLLLAFTLRGVDFGDVAQALRASSIPLFLLATAVALPSLISATTPIVGSAASAVGSPSHCPTVA